MKLPSILEIGGLFLTFHSGKAILVRSRFKQ